MTIAEIRERLTGAVIPAVPVPFDANGRLMDDALHAYARWMTGQRVGAVAVGVHTGRGLLLEDAVRERVMAVWRDEAVTVVHGAGIPPQVALPHDPARRTEIVIGETVRMAMWARDAGANAVLVYPPTALRSLSGVQDRVVALHEALADTGLPCLAFHLYEAAGGIDYDRQTIARLLDMEHIFGIKVATLDRVMRFQEIAAIVTATDRLLVTGEDRFLGYSLTMGAQSALIGMAAACTDVSCALMGAWVDGDERRFVECARRLDAFAQATFVPPMEGYVQRMLWALAADGVLSWDVCDPYGPTLPDGDRERVRAAVMSLRHR